MFSNKNSRTPALLHQNKNYQILDNNKNISNRDSLQSHSVRKYHRQSLYDSSVLIAVMYILHNIVYKFVA